MSKIIKCISNEEIEIVEYKNPRVCFNNNKYEDSEIYCVLRKRINPFNMYYENKDLQQRINNATKYIIQEGWGTEFDDKLLSILRGETN